MSFAEREEIALGRARGESVRCLAARLHRSPSTVSRELSRNSDQDGVYRSAAAHTRAYARAGRPKPAKLAANPRLRAVVQTYLTMKYSPEQIAGRLRREFPHDPEMWVSTDIAIYFCDPHSPWQRGTNENTVSVGDGLLRQYFTKGTDLTVYTADYLDSVAAELNDRPRKRLDFAKPIEKIGPLLLR